MPSPSQPPPAQARAARPEAVKRRHDQPSHDAMLVPAALPAVSGPPAAAGGRSTAVTWPRGVRRVGQLLGLGLTCRAMRLARRASAPHVRLTKARVDDFSGRKSFEDIEEL